MVARIRPVLGIAMAILAVPFAAAEARAEDECFDLVVVARIAAQVPSPMYADDDPDVIVMRWPWFLDLEIERVVRGTSRERWLNNVLALQHTHFRTDLGARKWWLRRNALGGYNLIGSDKPPRCAPGSPPASPYLRPGNGQSLPDIRRESEALYRR